MSAGTVRRPAGTVPTRLTLMAAVAALATGALVAPAVAAPAPTTGHAATQRALERAVAEGVPGAIARAQDRDGVWTATVGVGDRATGAPRTKDDRFRVASITKPFVATVLLQLEAERRLDLDDTVETWLPGVVRGNGHDGRQITLRQLLNHTSGVFDYLFDPELIKLRFSSEAFFAHRYDTWESRDAVAVAMKHPPYFAPGASWRYSNTNYLLAGLVIEKATGRSYASEIERRILRPLKLRATSVPRTSVTVPGPSGRAYSRLSPDPAATTVHDVTEFNPSLAGASGEMISDTKDLHTFLTALLRGKLLPREQLNAMTTTVPVPGDPRRGYGLGLQVRELSCGTKVWGHSGEILGSLSGAVSTRDGSHTLSLNYNAEWGRTAGLVVEAEFCG
ncbi:serine hydrolase domain-containing protein [Streptomyces sp. NPDC057638]|uniref:serine hydrolase domain-containing protein n=1 Tax=Streptomyces sp. NPDC057638 TaxID=3346190 RepID=UPI0036952706